MGSLLLQGWAMLEDCCEQCNVPLMRNRTKDKEVCVECNRDYKSAAPSPKPAEQKQVVNGAATTNSTKNSADDTLALKRLEEEKQKLLQERLSKVTVAPVEPKQEQKLNTQPKP